MSKRMKAGKHCLTCGTSLGFCIHSVGLVGSHDHVVAEEDNSVDYLVKSPGGYHYLTDDAYGIEPDLAPGLLIERGPHATILTPEDLRAIADRIETEQ